MGIYNVRMCIACSGIAPPILYHTYMQLLCYVHRNPQLIIQLLLCHHFYETNKPSKTCIPGGCVPPAAVAVFCGGGDVLQCMLGYTPWVWAWRPPRCGPGDTPQVWACSPPGCEPGETTPQPDSSTSPPRVWAWRPSPGQTPQLPPWV